MASPKRIFRDVAIAIVFLAFCYVLGCVSYRWNRELRGLPLTEWGETKRGLVAMVVVPGVAGLSLVLERLSKMR